jgi:hypothetical protein
VEPHLFWKESPLEIRRKFQVFGFPMGVVFNGKDLRTPKVRSIYKLKELIDNSKFPEVDLGDHFWNQFATECEYLTDIIKEYNDDRLK